MTNEIIFRHLVQWYTIVHKGHGYVILSLAFSFCVKIILLYYYYYLTYKAMRSAVNLELLVVVLVGPGDPRQTLWEVEVELEPALHLVHVEVAVYKVPLGDQVQPELVKSDHSRK